MDTMSYGYHYKRGLRVGYNISFNGFILFEVSSKDKARIISEIKRAGYKRSEIIVERVEL